MTVFKAASTSAVLSLLTSLKAKLNARSRRPNGREASFPLRVRPFRLAPMKRQSPDRRRPCIEWKGWREEPVSGIDQRAPCPSLRATRLAPLPLSTPTKKKHERARNESPQSLRPRATPLHRTSRGGRCGRVGWGGRCGRGLRLSCGPGRLGRPLRPGRLGRPQRKSSGRTPRCHLRCSGFCVLAHANVPDFVLERSLVCVFLFVAIWLWS